MRERERELVMSDPPLSPTGYCVKPYAMVMECVACGDLYKFLHDPRANITWPLRLKIAIGT